MRFTHKFDPQPDITAYEVALLLKNYPGSTTFGLVQIDEFLSAEGREHWTKVQRHFVAIPFREWKTRHGGS